MRWTRSSGPRGELIAPFVPLLRAPELMTRLQLVGEYLRFGSGLPPRLTELVILVVARRWDQDYEWGHHVPLARAAGLEEDVIAAVRDGGAFTGTDDVRAVWRLVSELEYRAWRQRFHVRAASDQVGDDGVAELVATAGYYTTLAMTMNVARTPVPDNYECLPPRSEHERPDRLPSPPRRRRGLLEPGTRPVGGAVRDCVGSARARRGPAAAARRRHRRLRRRRPTDRRPGDQAHLVGMSFGGLVAQHLAATHPALVASVLLADTVPVYPADRESGASAPQTAQGRRPGLAG